MKNDNESDAALNLDDEIEEFLGDKILGADVQLSPLETLKIIHQFEFKQRGLEQEIEELRNANVAAETTIKKYSEFYDKSLPAFYTLSSEGEIIELNQSGSLILGSEASQIQHSSFAKFVSSGTKETFNLFLKKIFKSNTGDSCEVILETANSALKIVYLTGLVAENKERCLVTAIDITERRSREANRDETARLIMMINTPGDFRKRMSDLTNALKGWTGCEAVGLRLSEGDDYPYFETTGFPDAFIRAENQLCAYGIDGNPKLDCICGNILCRRIDPAKPFFTPAGSFWTNNTTELLTNNNDRQIRMQNRCNSSGYESLALIPLRSGERMLGLLQFSDHRPDCFNPALIEDIERMADHLSFALASRKADEALRKREKRWAATLESISDAVISTSKAGKIRFMNSAAEELTGWKLHEALHKRVKDVFKIITEQTQAEAVNNANHPVLLGRAEDQPVNYLLIRKDGSEIPVDGSRSPIKNKNGKSQGVVFSFRDITERKIVEETMIEAREKAEENDRMKSAFLANMSHEIRTPMNGILGFAELLNEPKITGAEQLEYINIIEKSGERMLNIVNDIISISKAESGQMQVKISETNANDQIEFIYNFFKREAEQKGINLICKTPLAAKEAILKTDKEKVYAVLTNLVKNAIKFTWHGTIELGYERKAKYLEFYVKDTGSGIPLEQQALIFERFKQGSESLIGNHEGAGLGLAISKTYVEMLGGKIWVESQPGKGAHFFFTLPYDTEVLDNKVDVSDNFTSVDGTDTKIKKLKILIAEDDELATLFLTKVISKYSKEILKAKTGVEVVETCHKYPDIDLILMDIQMPEMDGYSATERIRRFDKDVIIIAQTAFALYGDSSKALESGCNDYISKPINQALLRELINKHFSIAESA